jgi:hypothetical protein
VFEHDPGIVSGVLVAEGKGFGLADVVRAQTPAGVSG